MILPDNPVEQYDMVNINTLGIGTYDSTEGTTFQMRGVYSDSAALLVTLDAGNNAIKLSFDEEAVADLLPQATTTQRGIGETSTDAEAQGKASITTFLTPSNLAALGASLTFAGLVELATDAETQAGVSTTLAVTPAGLASVTSLIQGTETFADSVARAGATPDFDGQVGVQLDTEILWAANGVGAGDFNIPAFMLGVTTNVLPTGITELDFNSNTLGWIGGNMSFAAMTVSLLSGSFSFGTSMVLQENGVDVPANSVLCTSSTIGQFDSRLINTFVSSANTAVYGSAAGGVDRTAFTTYAGQTISNPPTQAEVQAIDDALVIASEHLGALINDLRNTLKPHAT